MGAFTDKGIYKIRVILTTFFSYNYKVALKKLFLKGVKKL